MDAMPQVEDMSRSPTGFAQHPIDMRFQFIPRGQQRHRIQVTLNSALSPTVLPKPNDWLFTKVAAVVHHDGAVTNAAGLCDGISAVVITHMQDQNIREQARQVGEKLQAEDGVG